MEPFRSWERLNVICLQALWSEHLLEENQDLVVWTRLNSGLVNMIKSNTIPVYQTPMSKVFPPFALSKHMDLLPENSVWLTNKPYIMWSLSIPFALSGQFLNTNWNIMLNSVFYWISEPLLSMAVHSCTLLNVMFYPTFNILYQFRSKLPISASVLELILAFWSLAH